MPKKSGYPDPKKAKKKPAKKPVRKGTKPAKAKGGKR